MSGWKETNEVIITSQIKRGDYDDAILERLEIILPSGMFQACRIAYRRRKTILSNMRRGLKFLK